MRYGRAMRQMLMAGLLALLTFVPGVSLSGTATLGLGGPAMAQQGFAIDQFYDELAPYGEQPASSDGLRRRPRAGLHRGNAGLET